MKAKKVFIIYSGARVWGGIETYLDSLFSNYDLYKIDPTLVSLGSWDLGEKLSGMGAKVITLPANRVRFKTIAEIIEAVEVENADLLVSQGVVANYYARKVAQKTGLPLITTVHSDLEFDYPDEIIRLVYRLSDRLYRKYTAKFIAVSEYLKRELVRSGIKEEKITVIYNGIKKEEALSKKKGKETVIGSIGRFHSTKGYHNLIRALNFLTDQSIKLIIYGDGEERSGLEELINQENLTSKVSLPGYADDIKKALKSLDIFIQPSLMEGFGLTVVEAMMAGKPVIVTPVGSLPEIVKDGTTGLIAADTSPESLAVSIKTLIKNDTLAKRLAKAGRQEVVVKFSITKWITETEKTYTDIAK